MPELLGNLPRELREDPQWVTWKTALLAGRGGKTKPTRVPMSGRDHYLPASTTDPSTWATYGEAVTMAAERHRTNVVAAEKLRQPAPENECGIGFVFTESDPFCGVDFDDCRDPLTGEIHPAVVRIVADLDSYTEISPSGTGLHVITRAVLSGKRRRTSKTPWGGEFEIYDQGRFFTMTGRRLDGAPATVNDHQEQIDAVRDELLPEREQREQRPPTTVTDLGDAELVERAHAASNGAGFSALWRGDTSGYASASEADLALCNHLAFWTGGDAARMDSLFRSSGLMRDKWEREDYSERTIATALSGRTEFYDPSPTGERSAGYAEAWRAAGHTVEHLRPTERPIDDSDHGLMEVPAYPVEALPTAAGELSAYAQANGLPLALLGGPVIAALATAIGPNAQLRVQAGWTERAILWVSNIAPRGAGKSPAQTLAYQALRNHDAGLDEEAPTVLVDDLTMEALARAMAQRGGGGAFDIDELAQMLRGFGEYKGGGSGDRGRLLKLWTGAPWSFQRVAGGKKTNSLDLRITQPTLVICGGLQPHLHDLLGADDDGLRPRWLPHLAGMPAAPNGATRDTPLGTAWNTTIGVLLAMRDRERIWRLAPDARRYWTQWRDEWKRQAQGPEPPGVAGALVKADVHLARVALVLAEADSPGKEGGLIHGDTMHRAALIVQFTIDSWRALPEQGAMALTRRDEVLNRAVAKLAAWLEDRPDGKSTRREIQRARVAGVRRARDVDALLHDYEEIYPGSVTTDTPAGGGLPVVIVSAPRRRAASYAVSPLGDTVEEAATPPSENLGARAKSPAESGEQDGVTTPVVTPLVTPAVTPPAEDAAAYRERFLQRQAGREWGAKG